VGREACGLFFGIRRMDAQTDPKCGIVEKDGKIKNGPCIKNDLVQIRLFSSKQRFFEH